MPVISSIVAQKNKKRVNIYLDDKYSFSLDLDNLAKFGLKANSNLTQQQINEITKKGELQKNFDKTLNFVLRRPRSQKEIIDYFKRKKIETVYQQEILNKLVKLDLIDDLKFAKWWVGQRLEFKYKSKKDITFELRQKGIDSNLIKNVLDVSMIDELKIAKQLILKKEYKWKRYDQKERKQKISQYLLTKGFSWETIAILLET